MPGMGPARLAEKGAAAEYTTCLATVWPSGHHLVGVYPGAVAVDHECRVYERIGGRCVFLPCVHLRQVMLSRRSAVQHAGLSYSMLGSEAAVTPLCLSILSGASGSAAAPHNTPPHLHPTVPHRTPTHTPASLSPSPRGRQVWIETRS